MNWSDEGFLISKTRYNENSLIAELFTKEKGYLELYLVVLQKKLKIIFKLATNSMLITILKMKTE